MCLFHQPMAVFMFRDPVITVQKNFEYFYLSVTRLLVQKVKLQTDVKHLSGYVFDSNSM